MKEGVIGVDANVTRILLSREEVREERQVG